MVNIQYISKHFEKWSKYIPGNFEKCPIYIPGNIHTEVGTLPTILHQVLNFFSRKKEWKSEAFIYSFRPKYSYFIKTKKVFH